MPIGPDGLLRDEKGRIMPGTPPGPGRPKGSKNPLKTYQREQFEKMTNEEKDAFLAAVAPIDRWKMSEGNPDSNMDVTVAGQLSKEEREKIEQSFHEPTTPPATQGDNVSGDSGPAADAV